MKASTKSLIIARSIKISVFYLVILLSQIDWASGAANPAQQPVISGPLFIAVIYPVIEIKDELLENVEPIPDGYSFWGRIPISLSSQQAYFPAPLSYPYRFSKRGLITLQEELKKNPEVLPNTVQSRLHANIPRDYQNGFQPRELKQFIVYESYVSFRLKRWDHIELMAFPTFVVLTFDYTRNTITSNRNYQEVKTRVFPTITEFQTLEPLRKSLGISRQHQPWAAIPILTFTALDSYQEKIIDRIYFSGKIAPDEARRIFLQQVSLQDFSKGLSAGDPTVTHCHEISHEMSFTSQWRLYYAPIPIFYDKDFGQRVDLFPLHGPRGAQLRILRTALFINVTLPSLISKSTNLLVDLNHALSKLRESRIRSFDEFTDKINNLTVPISEAIATLDTRIAPMLVRLREAEAGHDDLLSRIRFPFLPPPLYHRIKAAQNEEEDSCLRLFSFIDKGMMAPSDRQKMASHISELRNNLRAIQLNRERLSDELAASQGFLSPAEVSFGVAITRQGQLRVGNRTQQRPLRLRSTTQCWQWKTPFG